MNKNLNNDYKKKIKNIFVHKIITTLRKMAFLNQMGPLSENMNKIILKRKVK